MISSIRFPSAGHALLVALAAIATLGSACSSSASGSTTGSATSGSSSTGGMVDCATPCHAKAQQCGATEAQATAACAQICGGSVTQDQLTCLEGKSCAELANATSLDALCPSSSSTSSTSSSGASSSSGGAQGMLGDGCPCQGNAGTLCMNVGDTSGCVAGLTCFGTVDLDMNGMPVNHATCTQKCTPNLMTGTSDCPNGFKCVDFLVSQVDEGNWCEKP